MGVVNYTINYRLPRLKIRTLQGHIKSPIVSLQHAEYRDKIKRSVSGTSGGRRITNTEGRYINTRIQYNIRGPLSDVIEAAATIIHNLHFTKPIGWDPNSRSRSVARFVFMVFRFESGPRRQFFSNAS